MAPLQRWRDAHKGYAAIMSDAHHRALEAMYATAPVNLPLHPTLHIEDGAAQVAFEATPNLFHAAGGLHGCYYFKALDDAAFFAANSLVRDHFVLTRQLNTHLLSPVTGGRIRAEGRVIHRTKRVLLCEAELYGADDHCVAKATGEFLVSRIPLTSVPSYAAAFETVQPSST